MMRDWAAMWRGRPTVYRCYSNREELLYIGCSINLPQRMRAHDMNSFWFPKVHRTVIRIFPDHATALAVETNAIWTERPRFNVNNQKQPRTEQEIQDRIRALMKTSSYGNASCFNRARVNNLRIRLAHLREMAETS